MQRRFWPLAFVALLPSCAAAGDCKLSRIAALDITYDSAGGPTVPMTIAGEKVHLLIDTGGIFSMLDAQTAQMLNLKLLPVFGSGEEAFGGKIINKLVEAKDIDLGGLKAERLPMQIIPDHMLSTGVSGTLAPNVLRHYDADFDFGHAKFNLFSQDHCDGQVVYWTSDTYAAIAAKMDDSGHLRIETSLDGQEIVADIDTGSSRSFLSLEAARRLFGIAPDDPKLKKTGSDDKGVAWFSYPFKALSLQGVTVADPDILLVSDKDSNYSGNGVPKFFLGMSTLRELHMYVAYTERKLYVTPAQAH